MKTRRSLRFADSPVSRIRVSGFVNFYPICFIITEKILGVAEYHLLSYLFSFVHFHFGLVGRTFALKSLPSDAFLAIFIPEVISSRI
jgi:hypothetical protein